MTDVLDASVGLVIAAAGVGRRMGGVDKALLRIRGKTLVENCLDNLGGYPGGIHREIGRIWGSR